MPKDKKETITHEEIVTGIGMYLLSHAKRLKIAEIGTNEEEIMAEFVTTDDVAMLVRDPKGALAYIKAKKREEI